MRALLVIGPLLVAGCLFAPDAVPGAQIACASNDECPSDRSCAPALGRCVFLDAEGAAPALSGPARIEPAAIAAGQTVTLTLVSDRPLARAPRAFTDAFELELTEQQGLRFVFTYTATGAEPEGPSVIDLELIGEDGLNNAGLTAGVVDLDFSPPALLQAILTPDVLALDGTLTLTLIFDELLERPPAFEFAPADALVFADEPPSLGAGVVSYGFVRAPDASLAPGSYELRAVAATDTLGNSGTIEVTDTGFFVDQDIPVISALTTDRDSYSRQAGAEIMRVRFDVSEPLTELGAILSVRVGGVADAVCGPFLTTSPNYTCTLDVADEPTLAEGTVAIVVTATDGAGNVGVQTTATRLDFSPPFDVSRTLFLVPRPGGFLSSVEALGDDAGFALSFAANEDLQAAVVDVDCGGVLVPLSDCSIAGTSVGCTFTVRSDFEAADGLCEVRALLTDASLNPTPAPIVVASFALDRTAPSETTDVDPNALLLLRIPFGAEQSLVPGSHLVAETFDADDELVGPSADLPPSAFSDDIRRVLVFDAPFGRPSIGDSLLTDGAWPAFHSNEELPRVWVRLIDQAGNLSGARQILNVEHVTTMGAKVAFDPVPNRAALELRGLFAAGRDRGAGAREVDGAGLLTPALPGVTALPAVRIAELGDLDGVANFNPIATFDRGRERVFGGAGTELFEHRGRWAHAGHPDLGFFNQVGSGNATVLFNGREDRVELLYGIVGVDFGSFNAFSATRQHFVDRTLSEATSVLPRQILGHRGVHDESRGVSLSVGSRTVVVINNASVVSQIPGTLAVEGTQFTNLAGAGQRHSPAMVWDPIDQRALLYGGSIIGDQCEAPAGVFNTSSDFLEWDGAAWVPVAFSGDSPGPRCGGVFVFDDERGRAVLYGGVDEAGPATGHVWEWDPANDTWLQVFAADDAPDGPGGLGPRAMVSPFYEGVTVFVGRVPFSWDGTRWTRQPSALAAETTLPARADLAFVATDPAIGTVLFLWERLTSTSFSGIAHLVDGDGRVDPTPHPIPFTIATPVTFSPALGGIVAAENYTLHLLEADFSWTELVTAPCVGDVNDCLATSHSGSTLTTAQGGAAERLLYVGANSGASPRRRWLELDPNAAAPEWTVIQNSPAAVIGNPAVARDPATGDVHIVGGRNLFRNTFERAFVYRSGALTELATGCAGGDRGESVMVKDERLGVMIVYGGVEDTEPRTDARWFDDGASCWRPLDVDDPERDGAPPFISGAAWSSGGRTFLAGGASDRAFTPITGVHLLAGMPRARVAQVFHVPFDPALTQQDATLETVRARAFAGGSHSGGAGAALAAWIDGRWVVLDANNDEAGAPTLLDSGATSTLGRVSDDELTFAIHGTGAGEDDLRSSVRLDYIEARLRYTLIE